MQHRQQSQGGDHPGIYLVQNGALIGPFTRKELNEDESVTENSIVQLGLAGKPFPAMMLLHRSNPTNGTDG